MERSRQGNGNTGRKKNVTVWCDGSKRETALPEEDHSSIASARSNGWAECRDKKSVGSAGINRSEAGDERALRERSNEPLGPEFGDELSRGNHRSIKQGIGGQGIELRKFAIRAPTLIRHGGRQYGRGRHRENLDSPA